MKNKKMLIAGASALALGVIGIGAFAYFSDSAEVTGTAKVGTVDVGVTGALTHSGNINNMNPGDNDPEVPDDYRDGTDHELTYTITNNGTKSVITRSIVRLSGTYNVYYVNADGKYTDAQGNVLQDQTQPVVKETKALTQADLEQIILSERATASTGVAATDADKDTGVVVRLTGAQMVDGKLVYTIGGVDTADSGDVLDGSEENEPNGAATSRVQTLDLGLDKDVTATNSNLMGATITIEVEVQAMQYRNTGNAEWATIFANTYGTTVQG